MKVSIRSTCKKLSAVWLSVHKLRINRHNIEKGFIKKEATERDTKNKLQGINLGKKEETASD